MVSKMQTTKIKWSRWQWDFDYNYLSFLVYAQSNNFEKKKKACVEIVSYSALLRR